VAGTQPTKMLLSMLQLRPPPIIAARVTLKNKLPVICVPPNWSSRYMPTQPLPSRPLMWCR